MRNSKWYSVHNDRKEPFFLLRVLEESLFANVLHDRHRRVVEALVEIRSDPLRSVRMYFPIFPFVGSAVRNRGSLSLTVPFLRDVLVWWCHCRQCLQNKKHTGNICFCGNIFKQVATYKKTPYTGRVFLTRRRYTSELG